MSLLLFANNAQTTLAGPIASTAVSVNVAAGTGSEFPSPGSGQYFVMTFNDQATKLLREIVWVTARSGDTLTILRGQEGTTAAAWLANDIAANWWTAGQASAMVQVAQLQAQATNYAQDTGSLNALVVGLVPTVASLASIIGAPIRVNIAYSNTGSSTLRVNSLAATLIKNPDGSNLTQGQLIAGHIYEFAYNGTTFDLLSSPYQLLGSVNTFAQLQTFTSGAQGAGGRVTGSSSRYVNLTDFTSLLATPGFGSMPSKLMFQWNNVTITATGAGLTTVYLDLPEAFPTSFLWCIANWDGTSPPTSGNCAAQPQTNSQIALTINTSAAAAYGVCYLAIGY